MADLADLLEHEDEVRGEVMAAVAYPVFVLCFGFVTVTVLLTVVLPRLFSMLQEMLTVLPLPTLILLRVSGIPARLLALIADRPRWRRSSPACAGICARRAGAEAWDRIKLKLPFIGPVFRAAALGRFARTLGTLVKSGVSLLPGVEDCGEHHRQPRAGRSRSRRVAEETRGGDSLAAPLRKLGIFPRTVVQMISVGEETGKLDEMLLKVADIEERHMRARTKTMISLLAPLLIVSWARWSVSWSLRSCCRFSE